MKCHKASRQATFLQITRTIHNKAPLVHTTEIAIGVIRCFDFFLSSFFLK